MAQKNFNFGEIFPKLIVSLFLFGLGIWVGRSVPLDFLPTPTNNVNTQSKLFAKDGTDFSTFWQVWDELNSSYLEKKDLSGEKLMQGATRGLVEAAGDPYTSYFDPDANKSFNDEISGTFEGVGIELGVKDTKLVVIAPLEDSPAQKAGILAGDHIIKIDDADATKMTIAEAVTVIRGKGGTKVKLTILRGEETSPKTFELTRATITVKTVKINIEGSVATINVNRFGENTNSEWDKVVNEVTTKGIKKIVLDLRNNTGGLLSSGIYVSSEFLKKGDLVVQQEDANGKRSPYNSDRDGRLREVELVVLINKGSASASEIVAGALRDHKRGELVGETSFGKGTIQDVFDYRDGAGLHITIAKWLTPDGTWVHKKGLEPDVKVELTEADIAAGKDPQLDRAKELLK